MNQAAPIFKGRASRFEGFGGCVKSAQAAPLKTGPVSGSGLAQVYLKPGELVLTHESCEIATVLGSCVAVTMFHAGLHLAAMCHGMLPEPKHGQGINNGTLERFKYLSEAIPFMAEWFRLLGVVSRDVEVKVFGGGHVLAQNDTGKSRNLVGELNLKGVRKLLKEESMLIEAGNVGGEASRKILFNTQTGEVLHRYL